MKTLAVLTYITLVVLGLIITHDTYDDDIISIITWAAYSYAIYYISSLIWDLKPLPPFDPYDTYERWLKDWEPEPILECDTYDGGYVQEP